MKEQLSSAVPPDSVQSDRTAGGPSDLEVGSQGTNQSAVSVPKAQVTSTTLDVAAPSTVPSSTSEPASISRRELGDDPDVLVSPHLRTITQSVGVPVSSSTSSGHVEA
ncbi:unnamed protein product [Mesocestoides corti]|nr:unnamed protein product [Mesocestoides corti]